MEAWAFTALQPCLFKLKPSPFPSQQRQLSLRRTSPLSQKCPPANTKVFASKIVIGSKQDLTSEPSGSWKIWLQSECGRNSSFTENPKSGPFESIPAKLRWAAILLYRVLLVGGIGLSMGAPAMAGGLAPSPSPASEVVVQKAVEKAAQKTAEKGAQKGAQNEAAGLLGDEFWKDIDLSKGSIELILKNILEGDPTNVPALECLAKRLVENDDLPHALLVFEKLEVLDPDEIEWKYMKAQVYDMNGQFKLAKKGFEDILKIEPFSSRALQGLVIVMDQLDETDAALKIVEDTMAKAKQENNLVEARNMGMLIGQFHMLKGHLHEALQHYKEMIDEDVNDFRPYLCQGIIYSVLGEKAMAEQQFKTFEKLCPKDFPDRKFLDGLMSRARKEGQKLYDLKQKQKSRSTKKGKEKQSAEQSLDK